MMISLHLWMRYNRNHTFIETQYLSEKNHVYWLGESKSGLKSIVLQNTHQHDGKKSIQTSSAISALCVTYKHNRGTAESTCGTNGTIQHGLRYADFASWQTWCTGMYFHLLRLHCGLFGPGAHLKWTPMFSRAFEKLHKRCALKKLGQNSHIWNLRAFLPRCLCFKSFIKKAWMFCPYRIQLRIKEMYFYFLFVDRK